MTQEQRVELVQPFPLEEIQVAIHGLNGEGATGPNGILEFFFRVFWEMVKMDVISTLREFQSGLYDLERLNSLHLFFLPNCQGAVRVDQY